MSERLIIAGDIGGTKTILQLIAVGDNQIVSERRYDSQSYSEFDELLAGFLCENLCRGKNIANACVGVAGPVNTYPGYQTAKVTNLPWKLDTRRLKQQFDFRRFQLINDFQAVGYGVTTLNASDLIELQRGNSQAFKPKLVVGAGTGLGVTLLVWNGQFYEVFPSEGGHTDFAPADELQKQLLDHLQKQFGHVSYERIVSGPGLVSVYRFLKEINLAKESEIVNQELGQFDPAAVISKYAKLDDPLAKRAMTLFISIYGAQTGNLALMTLPFSGIYIAGGIAPKIVEQIQTGTFLDAFADKGRMSPLLKSIPIHVVMNTKVGLIGAANLGSIEKNIINTIS